MSKGGNIISALSTEAQLKRKIRSELRALGFQTRNGNLVPPDPGNKDKIRATHERQKLSLLGKNSDFILDNYEVLSRHFANGSEVDPNNINLRLQKIDAGTEEADLFRFASYSWSVPVSSGFGRRLRYLVWDTNNSKLAGIIALGDPVYNLRVRENEIGWTPKHKKQNLVNVLDAYVLGAIPPYSSLLVGKVIACLVRSSEIQKDFQSKYGASKGIISGKKKCAKLLAVTTSSSMGRSSVYNRLVVNDRKYFRSIGYTKGWGHFHFSDELFAEIRDYLRELGHTYADNNRFGNGPNWKLRTVRTALDLLGIDPKLLRHGIHREAFICYLAENSPELLNSENCSSLDADFASLEGVSDVAEQCLERWVRPRAKRDQRYLKFDKEQWLQFNILRMCSQNSVATGKKNAVR